MLLLETTDLWMGIATAGLGLVLAFVVFFASPARNVHRWLAGFLFLDALNTLAATLFRGADNRLLGFANPDAAQLGFFTVAQVAYFALVPLYVGFIARAVRVPATKWLQGPTIRHIWWVLAIVLPLAFYFFRDAYRAVYLSPGAGQVFLYIVEVAPMLLATLFGIVAMAQSIRAQPPGSMARRRAQFLLKAFLAANIAWLWILTDFLLYAFQPGLFAGWYWSVRAIGYDILVLIHYGVLAFGIFMGQVLHMDRRLMAGATVSSTSVILASAFFVLSETIESLAGLSSNTSNIIFAGGLALAFRPMQVMAGRLITRAIMDPEQLAKMDSKARQDAFANQVEMAWSDLRLDVKERLVLDQVAEHLGLSTAQAAKLEKAVRRRMVDA